MDIFDLITNGWTIGGIVSLLVMILAKVLPEEKIVKIIEPMFYKAGVFVSKFLILRLGKSAAEKFETGIIKTLLSILISIIQNFLIGMINDNHTKKPTEKT